MKAQVFTSSMIIMALLTIMILFEYNQFYFFSKSKLMDYLVIDEMTDIANNHFKALGEIIGNNIYFENNKGNSLIFFESYLKNDYSPILLLNQYKTLLAKNNKGIKMTYAFSSLENDLASGKSQRNITEIQLSATHNYLDDEIIFQNISGINEAEISLSFAGQLSNLTTCNPSVSGKKITILGPNNYKYELIANIDCIINLLLENSTQQDNLIINLNVLSNNLTINYAQINELKDVNLKIILNSSYENLFKTSQAYNNVRLELAKGAYNLSKSFE
jgi:hypothetical protein